eukprot:9712890-Prorocentrum_lima.AAC.1
MAPCTSSASAFVSFWLVCLPRRGVDRGSRRSTCRGGVRDFFFTFWGPGCAASPTRSPLCA